MGLPERPSLIEDSPIKSFEDLVSDENKIDLEMTVGRRREGYNQKVAKLVGKRVTQADLKREYFGNLDFTLDKGLKRAIHNHYERGKYGRL